MNFNKKYGENMNQIGIMQGRLSPPQNGRLQFFPKNDWEKEFQLARNLGFSSIEWVIDWHEYWNNPVYNLRDVDESFRPIRKLAQTFKVPIQSACFDYLMKYTLFHRDKNYIEASGVLQNAIPKLAKMGVKIVTIAFVEDVAIKTEEDKKQIRDTLNWFSHQLTMYDMEIALETEMSGEELEDYIDSFNNPRIGICYDTGNCITMGHDLSFDIWTLKHRIKEVHLKDRKVGSRQSVYLGTGDVQFSDCFWAFKLVNFTGPYILQAWRGDNYLGDAKRQLEYARSKMELVQNRRQT